MARAGEGAGAFARLLRQLEAEHAREVWELREEVQRLRRAEEAASAEASPSPPRSLAGPAGGPSQAPAGPDLAADCPEPPPEPASSGPLLLRVTVVSASGLPKSDWGLLGGLERTADPYCICSIPGKPELEFRTQVIANTMSPVWNHDTVVSGWSDGDSLEFSVKDRDVFSPDDHLGRATLPCDSFRANGYDGEVKLSGRGGGGEPSLLRVRVQVAEQRRLFPMREFWETRWTHLDEGKSALHTVPSYTKPGGQTLRRRLNTMLDPSSGWRLMWDSIGVLLLLYDLAWIPMQAFYPPRMPFTTAMLWGSLSFWSTDILLAFNTGALSEKGEVIMDRRQATRIYMRKWFLPDLFILGMEWFFISVIDDYDAAEGASAARAGRALRVVRVFRLLRLMRLAKIRELIFAVECAVDSELLTLGIAVCMNLLTILSVNHYLACTWFFVGGLSYDGWAYTQRLMDDDVHFVHKYLVAMQWSMAQFTPGSSTVHPETVPERTFSLLVLVLGFVMATCFVSSITSTLSSVWSMKRNEKTQRLLLRKYLRQNNISRVLGSRVTRYIHCVKELRTRKVHPSKVEYLSLLSGPLHVALMCELRGPQLLKNTFFEKYRAASKEAFAQLCTAALEESYFARNDRLFSRSREATHMYFFDMGCTVYRQANLPDLKKLEAGQCCCENTLWTAWFHVGDMKALSDVHVTMLNAAKFFEVTQTHRHAFQLAKAEGRKFMERVRRIASFEPSKVTDLPLSACFVSAEGGAEGDPPGGAESSRALVLHWAALDVKRAEDMQMSLIEFSDSDSEGSDTGVPAAEPTGSTPTSSSKKGMGLRRLRPKTRSISGTPSV